MSTITPGRSTPQEAPTTRRRSLAVGIFAVCTLLVWVGRIRNAVEDDTLSDSERATSLTMAGIFIAVAVVVAVLATLAARSPHSVGLARSVTVAMGVAAAWTTGIWIWRIISIAGGDWSVGFVVVHLVLAVGSVALAGWALAASAAVHSTNSR